jgi:predicted dehydrogenase
MTRPLRVGVIGANPNRGWAKDSHIPALRSLENVQLAAVATTSRASADAAAAAFGVRAAYDDPRALITASDIDIVSVCVRVPYHRDPVLVARRKSMCIASGRSGVTAAKPPRWPPPRRPARST